MRSSVEVSESGRTGGNQTLGFSHRRGEVIRGDHDMSYPYPPTGPGEQPPGGQPGGWGAAPPPGGYGPSGPGWQHQETMAGGVPRGPPSMQPPQMQGPMI